MVCSCDDWEEELEVFSKLLVRRLKDSGSVSNDAPFSLGYFLAVAQRQRRHGDVWTCLTPLLAILIRVRDSERAYDLS